MSALVLVPSLLCLFFVLRRQTETAFLSIYLPTVLLFPEEFTLRAPHLPELSMSLYELIPIGLVALYRLVRKGHLVLMDFLVVSFLISLTVTEVLYEHVTKDGIFLAVIGFISMLLPYAVGRTMIEPKLRLATVQRIVLMTLLLGLPGVFEWRMGRNLYASIGKIFGATLPPTIQLRAGHGRLAVAFSDSEIAGIAIAIVATLNAWLAFLSKTKTWEKPSKLFSVLEKYHIAGVLLLIYVFFTQSRGPQLALAVGYLILQIPRFKNTKLASCIVALLIAVGAIGAYQYFSSYTNVADINATQNEQQGSALYRRRMLQLFQPILEKGGWLGWGYKSYRMSRSWADLSAMAFSL